MRESGSNAAVFSLEKNLLEDGYIIIYNILYQTGKRKEKQDGKFYTICSGTDGQRRTFL